MDEIDRALAELAVKNGSSEAEMAAERAQQSIRADPKWLEIKEVRPSVVGCRCAAFCHPQRKS
jgi:hypothetical protein